MWMDGCWPARRERPCSASGFPSPGSTLLRPGQGMAGRYNPEKLRPGYNILLGGEEVYFIPNPALGLWINRERF